MPFLNLVKPKHYSCLTEEQQHFYENLPQKHRVYIDNRAQGYTREQSYLMAGFKGNNGRQAGYLLENRKPGMKDILTAIFNANTVKQLGVKDSKLNKYIDAKSQQFNNEVALETINNADPETAKRIKFYRDIMNGDIKTVRIIKTYNKQNEIVNTKVEELSDVEIKIKARKELDRLLGLNEVNFLDKLQVGDITINIVDASKKDAIQDNRNNAKLTEMKTDVIDGDMVLVKEEKSNVKNESESLENE